MGAFFKQALGLAAIMVGTGCMNKFSPDRSFEVPYSKKPGELEELCPNWYSSKDRASVAFAELLQFKSLDETVDTLVYETYLMRDLMEICAGTYRLQATLRKGDTGGPAGTATELFVEEKNKQLVERSSRPSAPPGTKALLPGEVVVRPIAPGELSKVADRYVVALPPSKRITVSFAPFRADYEFKTVLRKGGAELAMENDPKSSKRFFDTKEGGLYEFEVDHAGPTAREPDRYSFYIIWGVPLSVTGYLSIVKWRTEAGTSSQ